MVALCACPFRCVRPGRAWPRRASERKEPGAGVQPASPWLVNLARIMLVYLYIAWPHAGQACAPLCTVAQRREKFWRQFTRVLGPLKPFRGFWD